MTSLRVFGVIAALVLLGLEAALFQVAPVWAAVLLIPYLLLMVALVKLGGRFERREELS